ncbi:MAG: 7-cyano-7-deazaguanine synthase QueC [Gammaproteobacteria bacterium]|nr:7-cyano-7-deazaguanine synthase QueC [Gammaproteobacteria bacterium]
MNNEKQKAVILVSGGLDSSTVLAIARDQNYDCYALSFDYGQRHGSELLAASHVVKALGVVTHKQVSLDMRAIGGSALTDDSIDVPVAPKESDSIESVLTEGIPVTYVPARNTIFLSYALAWAEVLEAQHIFIGVNAVDYSGYPDCRPEYIDAFQSMANLATRAGVEGREIKIHTPLINLSKAEIIRLGLLHGVDYSMTVSCYDADSNGRACGVCDSCRLRAEGFQAAGVDDPTCYQ